MRGCNVVLLKNPQIGDWSLDYADSIMSIATEYGAEFWDFANPLDIPLDLNGHYMDGLLMNYWGSVEYTNKIDEMIFKKFQLRDKRDDGKYDYWWEDYKIYKN